MARDQAACKLAVVMHERGLTLGQLADATGLPTSTLSRVARGLREPGVTTAIRIARTLGLPVEQIWVL